MPDDTTRFTEWLNQQRHRDGGTHWDGCWSSHPACAAIEAEARIERIIDKVLYDKLDIVLAAEINVEIKAAIREGDDG